MARIPLKLALRNVLRQRRRSASALGAITIGVASIIIAGGFVQDIFHHLAESTIHSQTGHIQIARAGYFSAGARAPEKYLIEDAAAIERVAGGLAGVVDTMARLNFSGLLGNGAADLSIFGQGMEADKEARLGTYVRLREGRLLTGSDRFQMIVGEGVAQSLKLQPGAPVSVLLSTPAGALNALDLEVAGIVQTFSKEYDTRAIRMPLATAQRLLDTRGVNVVVVVLKQTHDTAAIAGALAQRLQGTGLEVKPWYELSDFYEKAVQLYERQFGALQIVVLLMVALSAVNVVNSNLFERAHEFGTMRALGNRARDVLALVLTETLLLGLGGAALGVVVGWGLAAWISAVGIPMPPVPNSNLGYVARIVFAPGIALQGFSVGVAASVLAALLPAFRIVRTGIVEALRSAQ